MYSFKLYLEYCSIHHLSMHISSASIHQGDHTIFSQQSVGQQCIANSMMALLQAFIQQPHSWRVASLNTIICEGDRLYHLTNSQHEFLLPNEFPACVSAFNHTFQTNIKTKCFSSFTSDASVVCRLLHGALELTSNPYASRYAYFVHG